MAIYQHIRHPRIASRLADHRHPARRRNRRAGPARAGAGKL